MKKLLRFAFVVLFGSCMIGACAGATPIPAPQPMTPEVRVWPTPGAPGDSIAWQGLQMNMLRVELNDSFMTEYGSQRLPTGKQQFLWVQVQLKNSGQTEISMPGLEHFSALYAETEFKPTYGHRQGYTDYAALTTPLFPGQEVQAWLRFDVPVMATLKELRFVFLPESAQVGVLSVSPDYPYSPDHPTYVWLCAR